MEGLTEEPSECGAGANEMVGIVILSALEVLAWSEREGISSNEEDGFEQPSLCGVVVGSIYVMERPDDERYGERNRSA